MRGQSIEFCRSHWLCFRNLQPKIAILSECQQRNIPILAIRAVQAGALTSSMDRSPHDSGFDQSDFQDFEKAKPFRDLAN